MPAFPYTFAIAFVKLISVLVITLVLSGWCSCGVSFGFRGTADLSDIVPAAQPLSGGVFSPVSGETESKETLQITQNDDGTYSVTYETKTKEKDTAALKFFGPVAGLYVAQTVEGESYEKDYYIVKIAPDSTISISVDNITELMGELLFERMGLPVENASSVTQLTDNAALNWVMLQELMVRYRHRMQFEVVLVTRMGD